MAETGKFMISTPFKIHFIRHGEVHNPQQILYGRLPRYRLNAKGLGQADAAGSYLQAAPLQALFSSPLLRARQTAEQIRKYHHRLNIRISGLINEVCTSYEGCPGAMIDARDGDIYTGTEDIYEQPADVVVRTRNFIRRARMPYAGKEIAAVTHGDVITFMVLWAKDVAISPHSKTGLLKAGYPQAYPAHASITTLTFQSDDPEERPGIDYVIPW